MKIRFSKYEALGNDFIIIESRKYPGRRSAGRLAQAICDRRFGAGADGIIYMTPHRVCDRKIDVINADGGWAEKSGNGLRIAAVHLYRRSRRRLYRFMTGAGESEVRIKSGGGGKFMATADLGRPGFLTKEVPVKSRHKYHINSPLRIGTVNLPVTCLSVGNPHTIIPVDNFDFDWRQLGAEIETARQFPSGTNVEFVRVRNRKKIEIAEWERGAGATGSSGTGAAAAVCAMVMLGLVERKCEALFETGVLSVDWDAENDTVLLTGPVSFVMEGSYNYR